MFYCFFLLFPILRNVVNTVKCRFIARHKIHNEFLKYPNMTTYLELIPMAYTDICISNVPVQSQVYKQHKHLEAKHLIHLMIRDVLNITDWIIAMIYPIS